MSSVEQSKAGGLQLNTNNNATGLIVYGNVGLGTPTPTQRLQVGDGTGQALSRFLTDASDIYIGRNNTTAFGFAAGNTGFVIQDSTKAFPLTVGTIGAQPLVFGTSNTERARISSGGFLGVGLTNPQVKLDVSGPNVGYGGQLRISAPDYAQIVFYNTADMTLSNSARKAYIYLDVAAGTFHMSNAAGSLNLNGTAVNANGSPVCTPANGLCAGGGGGAVTSVNGMTGAVTGICQSNGANCPAGATSNFGGIYVRGNDNSCAQTNPKTLACTCPSGTTEHQGAGGWVSPPIFVAMIICY